MKSNTLYLIPTPLGKQKENVSLPEHTLETVRKLECFLVEKPQMAQSFLKWIKHPVPDYKITMRVLNKKTPDQEIFSFLQLLKEQDVGILSEAGAPGVADPGAKMVHLAHQNGFNVVPLTGPSSFFLALMASGLNGQRFSFKGYLSLNDNHRLQEIREYENESKRHDQTQIIMETPHRNDVLFDQLMSTLQPDTKLNISCNLTMPDEYIKTLPVHQWKSSPKPDLQKKPALFLFYSGK